MADNEKSQPATRDLGQSQLRTPPEQGSWEDSLECLRDVRRAVARVLGWLSSVVCSAASSVDGRKLAARRAQAALNGVAREVANLRELFAGARDSVTVFELLCAADDGPASGKPVGSGANDPVELFMREPARVRVLVAIRALLVNSRFIRLRSHEMERALAALTDVPATCDASVEIGSATAAIRALNVSVLVSKNLGDELSAALRAWGKGKRARKSN